MLQVVRALILAALLALPSSLAFANNYSADVLGLPTQEPTVLAYWRMTDANGSTSIVDASGNSNPLSSIVGGVTLGSTALVSGSADTSALFNGSTGYAQTAASVSALNFNFNQAFTVEAIVSLTSNSGEQIIAGNIDASGAFTGWEVSLTAGHPQFILCNTYPTNCIQSVDSTYTMSTGGAHHIVFQYDGSHTAAGVSVFVDDAFVANGISHDTLTTTTTTTQKITVGSRASSAPSSQFNGKIQELAIYNGRFFFQFGLSQATPSRHYSLAKGKSMPVNSSLALIGSKPNLLLNADMVYDCDDDALVAIASVLHKQGKVNLLGNITGRQEQYAASASNFVLAKYMGLALPTGPSQRTDYAPIDLASSFNPGLTTQFNTTYGMSDTGRGNTSLYPNNDIEVCRQALNSAANGSVIIASNSPLLSIMDCYNSASNYAGDGLGTGASLVAAKVARVYYVGGKWPNTPGGTGADYNFISTGTTPNGGYTAAAQDFVTNWPTEVIIVGPEMIYGPTGSAQNIVQGPPSGTTSTSPVQYAFTQFLGAGTPRDAFSLLLMLAAGTGISPYFEVAGINGTASVDASGNITYDGGASGHFTYLRPLQTATQIAAIGNTILADLPGIPPSGSNNGSILLRGVGALLPANDNVERRMLRLVAGR